MATCPPSSSMWYEDDHDPNPPFLKRREAETMHSCLVSFLLEKGGGVR